MWHFKYPKSFWAKTHVKDDLVMCWHMHFNLKCSKIEMLQFSFSVLFYCKIDHVFSQNAQLFYARNILNAPFFYFHNQMGHFKYFVHKKVRHFEKKHAINFETKKNRKSSILGHFKLKCRCQHVTKSSITCVLGHFIPV